MALAGPRRQHQEDLRARVAPDGAPLVGIEGDHRSGGRFQRLSGRLDLRGAVDDDEERVLLDLVISELLSGQQPDQDGAALVGGMEDDGRS